MDISSSTNKHGTMWNTRVSWQINEAIKDHCRGHTRLCIESGDEEPPAHEKGRAVGMRDCAHSQGLLCRQYQDATGGQQEP